MYLTKYQIIDYMLSIDKDLKLAYELKEEYRVFNSTANSENANKWLDELILKLYNSNIEEYCNFIHLLQNWRNEIINSFNKLNGHIISNGPMERVNRDIKTIFSIFFGSTNFSRVRNRIMFSINDRLFFTLENHFQIKKLKSLEVNTNRNKIILLELGKRSGISTPVFIKLVLRKSYSPTYSLEFKAYTPIFLYFNYRSTSIYLEYL